MAAVVVTRFSVRNGSAGSPPFVSANLDWWISRAGRGRGRCGTLLRGDAELSGELPPVLARPILHAAPSTRGEHLSRGRAGGKLCGNCDWILNDDVGVDDDGWL